MKVYYGSKGDYVYLSDTSIDSKDTYVQIGNKKRNIASLTKNADVGKDIYVRTENNENIYATEHFDIINVNVYGRDKDSAANHKIYALGGDDIIYALDGNNTIYAGEGHDFVITRESTVYGEDGNDHIRVDGDSTIVYGGKGNDYIRLQGEAELHFSKGDGNDTIDGFFYYGSYVFDDIDDIVSNLNFSQNNNDFIISYGNEDTITLHNTGTFIGTSDALFNTISNSNYSQIYGNFSIAETPMINIKADGTIDGNWFIYSEGGNSIINNSHSQTQIISMNGTVINKTDDMYWDLTDFDSVVEQVAGWLSDNGYIDVKTLSIKGHLRDNYNRIYSKNVDGYKIPSLQKAVLLIILILLRIMNLL